MDDNLARTGQHPPAVTERSQLRRTVLSAGNERKLSIAPAPDKDPTTKKFGRPAALPVSIPLGSGPETS